MGRADGGRALPRTVTPAQPSPGFLLVGRTVWLREVKRQLKVTRPKGRAREGPRLRLRLRPVPCPEGGRPGPSPHLVVEGGGGAPPPPPQPVRGRDPRALSQRWSGASVRKLRQWSPRPAPGAAPLSPRHAGRPATHQLLRPHVVQYPLRVLAVVPALHDGQQQLGGVILSGERGEGTERAAGVAAGTRFSPWDSHGPGTSQTTRSRTRGQLGPQGRSAEREPGLRGQCEPARCLPTIQKWGTSTGCRGDARGGGGRGGPATWVLALTQTRGRRRQAGGRPRPAFSAAVRPPAPSRHEYNCHQSPGVTREGAARARPRLPGTDVDASTPARPGLTSRWAQAWGGQCAPPAGGRCSGDRATRPSSPSTGHRAPQSTLPVDSQFSTLRQSQAVPSLWAPAHAARLPRFPALPLMQSMLSGETPSF